MLRFVDSPVTVVKGAAIGEGAPSKQPPMVTNSTGEKSSLACFRTQKASQRRSQTRRPRNRRSKSRPSSNAILAKFDDQVNARRKCFTIKANECTIRLQLNTSSDIATVSLDKALRKRKLHKVAPQPNTTLATCICATSLYINQPSQDTVCPSFSRNKPNGLFMGANCPISMKVYVTGRPIIRSDYCNDRFDFLNNEHQVIIAFSSVAARLNPASQGKIALLTFAYCVFMNITGSFLGLVTTSLINPGKDSFSDI
ncbi:sodium/dicarboxylate symporter-related [Clonorchis sinensis]|uniref:Sodium/dicarboxylate symporter-related n=1 Tax=Clonorchis sinensis TaxID=79923 RepID=G7YGE4_CLOSI|nr:sodium/dicarboxylate symporter-related [Clonorchis sinensis]